MRTSKKEFKANHIWKNNQRFVWVAEALKNDKNGNKRYRVLVINDETKEVEAFTTNQVLPYIGDVVARFIEDQMMEEE